VCLKKKHTIFLLLSSKKKNTEYDFRPFFFAHHYGHECSYLFWIYLKIPWFVQLSSSVEISFPKKKQNFQTPVKSNLLLVPKIKIEEIKMGK
jgi:hypothetical protein